MTEPYAAAFNSSTNDPWRDPGSLTGTWIVLLGTITFFPTIFVVVFLWNLVMRASSAACCPRVLKIDWIRRIQRDFGHWYGPTAIVIHSLISLASAGIFLYLVIIVNRQYDAGKSRPDLVDIFRQQWLIWTEFAFSFTDVVHILTKFLLLPRKLDILTDLDAILTIMVSVSGIAAPFLDFYYWGFMCIRFAQVASVLTSLKAMKWRIFNGLIMQVIVMICFFISLVFTVTGLVFTYENVYFTGGMLTDYFVAFYMTGITLTTVGYGDFSPVSHEGRIVIILGVISAFWMVPPLIAAVLEPWGQYQANRSYAGSGHVLLLSLHENVENVIEQFYKTKKTVAENMLLMTPSMSSSSLKGFLKSQFMKLRIQHFEGDWTNPDQVSRCVPNKAHYIALVQDKFSDDPEAADANTVAGALSVFRVCKNVPMYVQLYSSAHSLVFDHNQDNILCMEDMRRGLLVQNCTAPGALSVFSNLIFTKSRVARKHRKGWLAHYKNGLCAQFETNIALDPVVGHTFSHVCAALRALYSITFVSIYNETDGIMILPIKRVIEAGDIGQFIHDLGSKDIETHLNSDHLQKYLIIMRASELCNSGDACNVPKQFKAETLQTMLGPDDAGIVERFNLFQRSAVDLKTGEFILKDAPPSKSSSRRSSRRSSIEHDRGNDPSKPRSRKNSVSSEKPPAETADPSPRKKKSHYKEAGDDVSPEKPQASPDKDEPSKEQSPSKTRSSSRRKVRDESPKEEDKEVSDDEKREGTGTPPLSPETSPSPERKRGGLTQSRGRRNKLTFADDVGEDSSPVIERKKNPEEDDGSKSESDSDSEEKKPKATPMKKIDGTGSNCPALMPDMIRLRESRRGSMLRQSRAGLPIMSPDDIASPSAGSRASLRASGMIPTQKSLGRSSYNMLPPREDVSPPPKIAIQDVDEAAPSAEPRTSTTSHGEPSRSHTPSPVGALKTDDSHKEDHEASEEHRPSPKTGSPMKKLDGTDANCPAPSNERMVLKSARRGQSSHISIPSMNASKTTLEDVDPTAGSEEEMKKSDDRPLRTSSNLHKARIINRSTAEIEDVPGSPSDIDHAVSSLLSGHMAIGDAVRSESSSPAPHIRNLARSRSIRATNFNLVPPPGATGSLAQGLSPRGDSFRPNASDVVVEAGAAEEIGAPYVVAPIEASKLVGSDDIEIEEGQKWDQAIAKRTSLEGHVSDHIVACGRADEMTASIGRRLYRRTPDDQFVVLLVSHIALASKKVIDQLTALANLDRVYVLIGMSQNPNDLKRAGAVTARVCLILPDSEGLGDATIQAAQDSNMLITFHLLNQTDTFPVIELMKESNEQLMYDGNTDYDKLLSARGCIFKRSLFDNLLTQAIFKPRLIRLFSQLSDASISHVPMKRLWTDLSDARGGGGTLLFGQVFTYLLEHRLFLAIAVYRKKSDAQEQWQNKKMAKMKSLKGFASVAGKAFRQSKKNAAQHGTPDAETQVRIAINNPPSNMSMLKSDVIFVVEYNRNLKLAEFEDSSESW